jgi:LPS-assembly lipoprotein
VKIEHPCASSGQNGWKPASDKRKGLLVLRLGALAFAVSLAAGCGFTLRGAAPMQFETVAVQAPEDSVFAAELRRSIAGSTTSKIVRDPKAAALRIDLLGEERTRESLTVNAQGRVREYSLFLKVRVRAQDAQGNEIMNPTEFTQRRDVSFNENILLAKESEDQLLYRDMASEIVQLVARRVSALKPHGSASSAAPAK